ncbi:MAG: DUF393 domain-containing protein [Gemmatales bacterium]
MSSHIIASQQATVLYDGQCAFCRKSVSILKKLDWFHSLRYQDCRDIDLLPKTQPSLDPQRLIEEMHLVPPSGSPVYSGFRAFRWMAWRFPIFWLIVPLLYLPGVPWVGNKVYLWIARNRFKLVPCKDGVCEIPAKSK